MIKYLLNIWVLNTFCFSCLQDPGCCVDGCLKSVNLFPDKVLRGVITMMTLRFDMMSKMYRGKSGPCHGETLVIQIDPKVMVWYLMWLSIILAADTTSNIFSELVNLQRRGWCLREYKRHSSSSRIAFKPWILNMLWFILPELGLFHLKFSTISSQTVLWSCFFR